MAGTLTIEQRTDPRTASGYVRFFQGAEIVTEMILEGSNIRMPVREAFSWSVSDMDAAVKEVFVWIAQVDRTNNPMIGVPKKFDVTFKRTRDILEMSGKMDTVTFHSDWEIGSDTISFRRRNEMVLSWGDFQDFIELYKEFTNRIHRFRF